MIVSRRGAGTGSIIPRGANHWRVQIDLGRDPITQARIRRRFSVTGSKKAAEEALRTALSKRDHGIDVKPERMTVAEYLDRWLLDYAAPRVARATYRSYRQIAERL